MLIRTSGPKTQSDRRLRDFIILFSPPDVITVIRCARRVTRVREMKMHTKLYTGSCKRRDHLGDLGVDGRMILK
jgi:hypothetical protein